MGKDALLVELVLCTFTTHVVNPVTFRRAGRANYPSAALHHIGRQMGRPYVTPLAAEPVGGGFVIPLVYGEDTGWCRNLLAAGRGTLDLKGGALSILNPRVVDLATVQDQVRATQVRTSGFEPLTRCLQIRRQLNSARDFRFPCIPRMSIDSKEFHSGGYNGGYRKRGLGLTLKRTRAWRRCGSSGVSILQTWVFQRWKALPGLARMVHRTTRCPAMVGVCATPSARCSAGLPAHPTGPPSRNTPHGAIHTGSLPISVSWHSIPNS